jgi:hypothetical protein
MKHRVTDSSIYVVAVLIIIAWVGASILLELLEVGLPIRILIGLVPVSLLIFQIIQAFRYTLGQDEVQKRIILEGLAIAFAIALPVIFLIGFIMKAGISLPFEFIDSGYFLEVALLVGYAIAYRRYQ